MNNQVGIIYETKDYKMFKHLEGNRTDAVSRGAKIIESIHRVGYIMSPIAVNENYEVIDGQGRLYAFECEDIPVHYYIVPGAGINECIAMNIYGTKWKTIDYIGSYADRGCEHYIRLQKLIDSNPEFELDTILTAATLKYGNKKTAHDIQNGLFELDDNGYDLAMKRLAYCKRIKKTVDANVNGSKRYFYMALIFIYDTCPGKFDRDRVISKIELLHNNISAIVDIDSALKSISELYNYKSRQEKMYFDVEYDKYMCKNVPGYAGKWSKIKK